MRRAVALLPLALVLLAASPRSAAAGEGYYLEEELVQDSGLGPPRRETSKTWLAAGMLRKEQPQSGTVTIVRSDRAVVWVLDTAKKTYFEIRRETLDKMGELGVSMLLGEGNTDPSGWMRKTGNRRQVGPWQAYEVRMEDKPVPGAVISMWLSSEVPIPASFREQFGPAMGGASSPLTKLLSGLRGLEGYPVEVVMRYKLGTQSLEVRQTLLKVEKLGKDDAPEAGAAGRFDIPAGFSQVPSPFDELVGAQR